MLLEHPTHPNMFHPSPATQRQPRRHKHHAEKTGDLDSRPPV
ncbi:Hypothetical protein CpOVI2C_01018 [Corynebacterium pseudotuberculosis]|nr:Hypothetical protein Cp3995_1642 [Corynebacterium pseudotuberculosis 3/99-5]AIG09615.1 hypothetical protein CPTB_01559 [Corynebacterium pseudotuberculosis]AIG12484.1 hypothetical protein CPTC_02196 [Corynebacterium pseudotuberculosis]AKC74368.1 Hypothetical protein Cp226_1663 [Corynebacterium pseudotuberculosis]AQU93329.1 Hypothetical protein CpMIC6_1705 [Corynebacterium pseudotuberculosis]